MSTSAATYTHTTTIEGLWVPSSSSHGLEVQGATTTVAGRREPALLQYPLPARTPTPRTRAGTNPVDDFFGVVRGTQDSRHDDAPPPYASTYADAESASDVLPSYASVAEPPTLAMHLFKFGFLFPPFWLAGTLILLFSLSAPEGWEPSKSAAEREELLACLRRTEVKWAKRCLIALVGLLFAIAGVVLIAIFARRT